MNAALSLTGINAGYGSTSVLHDVDLTVARGSAIALLGPNGAGKTTLLRVASGLLRPSAGAVHLDGRDVTRWQPFKRRQAGLCLVPEGRGIFPNLTVRDNLHVQVARSRRRAAVDQALVRFPDLSSRLGQLAGSMSGGQQQMLALARCYLRNSDVVLIDEASMGLAPIAVDEVYLALSGLRDDGTALLIVEQFVDRALALADDVYVLAHGTTEYLGTPSQVDRDELMSRYLGATAGPATDQSRAGFAPSPTSTASRRPGNSARTKEWQ